MKKLLLTITILLLIGSFGYGEERLSPEKELAELKSKIADIENQCTPKKGTPKESVERIFGEGKPAPLGKIPTASPDSPARSYEICENGTLYVYYEDDKVLWAHYIDPYSVKGRDREPSVKEQLVEARPRLKQLEVIQAVYLKRINELKQPPQQFDKNSPLTVTIKSDKQVYKVGEEIKITLKLINNSNNVQIVRFSPSSTAPSGEIFYYFSFRIFRDGKELDASRWTDLKRMEFYKGRRNFEPGQNYEKMLIINKLDWRKEDLFNVAGKYEITVIYWGLIPKGSLKDNHVVSNTITIEVVEKK